MPHAFPVYVNSKNRSAGTTDNFTIDFKDYAHKYEKAKISVLDVQIPYSYYNINSYNNHLSWYNSGNDTSYPVNLTIGNYSIYELVNTLQSKMNSTDVANTYTVSYDDIRKYINFSASTNTFYFDHITDGTNTFAINVMGFTTQVGAFLTQNSPYPIKLGSHNFYLYASSLTIGYNTVSQNYSKILCKIPCNYGLAPEGDYVDYRNQFPEKFDVDNFLTSCSFHLEDENGNPISLHGLDWQFTLLLETD